MNDELEERTGIEEAAHLIVAAHYVVAVVGAGMSVESGIPPFRGPGGLWTRLGEPDMRGFQRFLEDPKGWWGNYLKREGARSEFTEALEQARPNPGHYALAELEAMGILCCIITQNIDNLHQEAGSQKVAEIHGNRHKLRCIQCGQRFQRDEFPIVEIPPRCTHCGGLVKGDGVMFGEPIPTDVLARCQEEAFKTDCALLIGTSAVVYPAAGLPFIAKDHGASLIEINPLETPLSLECDVVLRGPSGEILPRLVEKIKALGSQG